MANSDAVSNDDVIIRHACRALLLTETREVLLMQVKEPQTDWQAWITPGGGREGNEAPLETLRRELYEEVHLENFQLGPHIWNRSHRFDWEGRKLLQHEAYYLIDLEKFAPGDTSRFEDIEARAFLCFRWWNIDEILASDEVFVPGNLGELLKDMVENGPLPNPIRVGV